MWDRFSLYKADTVSLYKPLINLLSINGYRSSLSIRPLLVLSVHTRYWLSIYKSDT